MKTKNLILGDGLLGSELVKQTGWNFVSRKVSGFDINDLSSITKGYNVIVNCIAHTDTYSKERDIHMDVNVRFVKDLINYCNKHEIKLVHISTDFVYANNGFFAKEDDIPRCDNSWYAFSKMLADEMIILESNNYLVCRCSHKPKPFPYDAAWVNYYTNADYVDVIADLIIKLINKDVTGIINVGTSPKTMLNLAKQTKADVVGDGRPLCVPENVTMDISKLEKCLNI